ncbi:hypothetical protein LMOATCC19117_0383 [Listeria monocytogenes ATCC 19117]|nr:hypothetical protein LMOATCC19117_0383 [Listeria monocytogenes ATCC 19117]
MGVLCKKFIFRAILVVYMNEINHFYPKKIARKLAPADNFSLFTSFDAFF